MGIIDATTMFVSAMCGSATALFVVRTFIKNGIAHAFEAARIDLEKKWDGVLLKEQARLKIWVQRELGVLRMLKERATLLREVAEYAYQARVALECFAQSKDLSSIRRPKQRLERLFVQNRVLLPRDIDEAVHSFKESLCSAFSVCELVEGQAAPSEVLIKEVASKCEKVKFKFQQMLATIRPSVTPDSDSEPDA